MVRSMNTKTKTLRQSLPTEFFGEFSETRAAKFLDIEVIEEIDGCRKRWPGPEKNVLNWWKLANGKAVGWNENPARGWSFPVITLKDTKLETGTFKAIEYAYPGSSNAEQFGFKKEGCWCVELIEHKNGVRQPPKAAIGCNTYACALGEAQRNFQQKWAPYFLATHPELSK